MLGPRDSLRSHWRPSAGWTAGAYVTWHLLPSPGGAVATAAAAVRTALTSLPALDPVPEPWLHLTLQGVAQERDLARDRVDAVVVASQAALRDVPGPLVAFGPPTVHREGVLVEGGPAGPVAAVRSALRRALVTTLGHAPGGDDDPVWPHVSLAYANTTAPAAPVLDALAAAGRPEGPDLVTETFRTVSLISLRREGHLYRWDLPAALPLG